MIEHPRLRLPVAERAGALQPGLVGGHPVTPVTAAVVEAHRGGGQLPGDLVPARRCGQARRRSQAGPLRLTPGERLIQRSEAQRLDTGRQRAQRDPAVMRGDDRGGRLGGVQVPGEDPADRGGTVRLGLLGAGPVGRIHPEQIVEAVPVRGGRFQQMHVDQHVQRGRGRVFRLAQQRRGSSQAERRAGPQAEQAERLRRADSAGCGGSGQAGEADLEGRPNRQVARAQLVQPPPLVGQPTRQGPHGPVAPGGEPGAGDPDRQWQADAGREHLAGRLGFGGGAVLADDPGEQGAGLVLRQHVEVEDRAASQFGQPGASRDQHGTGRAAW